MSNDTRILLSMDDAPGYAAPRQPVEGWNPREVWRTRIHEPRAQRIAAATAGDRSAGMADATMARSPAPATAPPGT